MSKVENSRGPVATSTADGRHRSDIAPTAVRCRSRTACHTAPSHCSGQSRARIRIARVNFMMVSALVENQLFSVSTGRAFKEWLMLHVWKGPRRYFMHQTALTMAYACIYIEKVREAWLSSLYLHILCNFYKLYIFWCACIIILTMIFLWMTL